MPEFKFPEPSKEITAEPIPVVAPADTVREENVREVSPSGPASSTQEVLDLIGEQLGEGYARTLYETRAGVTPDVRDLNRVLLVLAIEYANRNGTPVARVKLEELQRERQLL